MPRRFLIVLWIVPLVAGLDQYSKYWATTHLQSPQAVCIADQQACWESCRGREQKTPCQRSCEQKNEACLSKARKNLASWTARVKSLKASSWCREVRVLTDLASPECVVIPGLLSFRYALNPGSAWGVFGGLPVFIRRGLFGLITLLAFVFLVSMLRRARDEETFLILGISGIASGAVGNFLDRFRANHVIDFIDVYIRSGGNTSHWPTFNIADIAITLGVVLFAIHTLFGGNAEADASEEKQTTTENKAS
ncbi:MAG: signal peptidase II [Myxococcales bacterium]|nr:signal peptidase II [Myxococcales bacterium]MCB9643349.1 signal peptidase II [Myxococcales bacterium]